MPTHTEVQAKNEKRSSWRITPLWMPDSRASAQHSLLRLLAIAHTERIVLVPLVQLLADEHRGFNRSRLQQFSQRLAKGISLIDALEQTPGVLSDEDVLTLRCAHQSGTFTTALDDLIHRNIGETQETRIRLFRIVTYFGCVAAFGWILVGILMALVAPTYKELAITMGIGLQKEFTILQNILSAIFLYAPIAALLLSLLLIATSTFRPLRRITRTLASRWIRPIAQLRTAQLLRNLSLTVASGRPIPGALSTLARYHFDSHVRSKLLFARNEVEQGADPWSSLSVAKLISPDEASAIGSPLSSVSRSWLLTRLAHWKEEQFRHRSLLFLTLLHPALVLLFGAFVLWVSVAFFGLLVQLISSLS
jgi:type II secretory pathway component PulF